MRLQRRRIVVQVVHQHKRHCDVRRKRHVVVDGHFPQLVRHRRQVLPVRRAELHDALLVLDLRWLSGQLFHSGSPTDERHFSCKPMASIQATQTQTGPRMIHITYRVFNATCNTKIEFYLIFFSARQSAIFVHLLFMFYFRLVLYAGQ